MRSLPISLALLGIAALSPQPTMRATQEGWTVPGVLHPYRSVKVGAAIDGLLAEVLVDRGDRVEPGQVLGSLSLEVERATAALALARTGLSAARNSAAARLEQARDQLLRHEALLAEGLITEDQLGLSRTDEKLAELAYRKTLEDEAIAQLEYERSVAVLEQGTLRSPIRGVITERFLNPGELLSRSGVSEVLSVCQLDPLRIETHAPLALFDKIQVGDSVPVRFPELGIADRQARVTVVDRVIDTASASVGVRLELSNRAYDVPAGAVCEVVFQGR